MNQKISLKRTRDLFLNKVAPQYVNGRVSLFKQLHQTLILTQRFPTWAINTPGTTPQRYRVEMCRQEIDISSLMMKM